jgi:hypothetical protein
MVAQRYRLSLVPARPARSRRRCPRAPAPRVDAGRPGWREQVDSARVLLGQADDQLYHVLVQRWSAGLVVRGGPGAGHHASVPAQRVSGLTKKKRPAGSGHPRLMAASSARSAGPGLGRAAWRRSTLSWWRRTRISRSLAASSSASRARSWMEASQNRPASTEPVGARPHPSFCTRRSITACEGLLHAGWSLDGRAIARYSTQGCEQIHIPGRRSSRQPNSTPDRSQRPQPNRPAQRPASPASAPSPS